MLSWLANAWKVRELRKRVLFTAAILALYRLGCWMPAPGVDSAKIKEAFQNQGGTVISLLNLFSGGALSKFSLFALGIMPYITASIIMQLMTAAVPQLEQIQKEGESGQAKITQYTRYFTLLLSFIQAVGWTYLFHKQGYLPGSPSRFMLIILTLTTGSMLLMWLGELITKRGVGNGISLLVFASIIDGLYGGLNVWINGNSSERLFFPILVIVVIVAVVFVQEGQRKIPIQYAKRVVGRRMTTGGSTYMPLRVIMAGVIPVIFAAAIMSFPPTIALFFPATNTFINTHFQATGNLYISLEAVLIIAFTFFYTAVQFNPVDQADNLRKNGGYVPGIRPGPPTAQYFDRVMTRLTLPGSLFLALIAIFPVFVIKYAGFSHASSRALGGTSILIVVGVALDTMRQMESQMMARSYEGFLK
jgi:preprotein translocase subunit SecY